MFIVTLAIPNIDAQTYKFFNQKTQLFELEIWEASEISRDLVYGGELQLLVFKLEDQIDTLTSSNKLFELKITELGKKNFNLENKYKALDTKYNLLSVKHDSSMKLNNDFDAALSKWKWKYSVEKGRRKVAEWGWIATGGTVIIAAIIKYFILNK